MIIVGYGYADCLLGGAIVALKEKEEGRGTELRFSSMNGLAGVLAGVLLQEKRLGVIYLRKKSSRWEGRECVWYG